MHERQCVGRLASTDPGEDLSNLTRGRERYDAAMAACHTTAHGRRARRFAGKHRLALLPPAVVRRPLPTALHLTGEPPASPTATDEQLLGDPAFLGARPEGGRLPDGDLPKRARVSPNEPERTLRPTHQPGCVVTAPPPAPPSDAMKLRSTLLLQHHPGTPPTFEEACFRGPVGIFCGRDISL